MSLAEDLLNSLSEEVPVHTHPVPDTDTYFIIDPITRKIENTNRKKNVIMQYDHNSERFTFELPRYVDGHDMLECTSVVVNVDNIEVVETDGTAVPATEPRINSDAPEMIDLRAHLNDPEKVISSWLIARNSTQLAGKLSFHIEYKCVDAEGNVVYEWGTDTYDEIEVKARKKNSDAIAIEHADRLEQWHTRIFGAGDSVVANIATEGAAQVAAVKAESETQQEAIGLKGAQTLESIPEDYTETSNKADEAVRSKANAIVCETSGESIVLKDSSNDYMQGLKVFGKSTQSTTTGAQLFDANKLPSKELHGCSVTNNGDGSFTISGGDTLLGDFTWYKDYTHEETVSILKSGELFFNVEKTTYPYLYISIKSDNGVLGEITNITDTNIKRTITKEMLDDETAYLRIGFWGAINRPLVPGTIRPMLYQDGDGTWEPYTGGKPSPNPDYPQDIVSVENPVINVHGKNLAKTSLNIQQVNGYTLTPNNDGSVTVTGSAAAAVDTVFDLALVPIKGGVYEKVFLPANTYFSISCMKNGALTITPAIRQLMADGTIKWGWSSIEQQDRYITKIYRQFIPEVGDTSMCGTYAVQIELGDVTTDYEPHKPAQSIALPNTLSGIPVTSGGNYTDFDGQQWICDEVDLERGVYVQRIREITYNGTDESWFRSVDADSYMHHTKVEDHFAIGQGICYCDKLLYKKTSDIQAAGKTEDLLGISPSPKYNVVYINLGYYLAENTPEALAAYLSENPITLHYVLATPIETPLTAEEITAFKALRTNYPNTTILNDAGAWMSVKYNADTKTYVENPKILKLVDPSTGVVYELKIVDGNLTVSPV